MALRRRDHVLGCEGGAALSQALHIQLPAGAVATRRLDFAYIIDWRITSEVFPLQWHQVHLKAGYLQITSRQLQRN
jgi:hypothetical protein